MAGDHVNVLHSMRRNFPVGMSHCSNMDILVKTKLVPGSLMNLTLNHLSSTLVQWVWKNYKQPWSMSCVQDWVQVLPRDLLQALLPLLNAKVKTLLDRSQSDHVTLLPIFQAWFLELVFRPDFKELTLKPELQWHKESRTRIFHKIHQDKDQQLHNLKLACYQAPIFQYESLHFSERFVLFQTFLVLKHLRCLYLPNVCDDELLVFIGRHCPSLTDLDIEGSESVSNTGFGWLLGRQMVPTLPLFSLHQSSPCQGVHGKSLQARIARKSHPCSRPGFQATPLVALQSPQKSPKGSSLRMLNIKGTRVDHSGLEAILTDCHDLGELRANETAWLALLEHLQQTPPNWSRPGLKVSNIHLKSGRHLTTLGQVLPNLRNLTLEGEVATSCETLFNLSRLKSLELKDMHWASIGTHLERFSIGLGLSRLDFHGPGFQLDLSLLASLCPGLAVLNIRQSQLVSTSSQSRFPQLVHLQLWETKGKDGLIDLMAHSPRLEKVLIWNVTLRDEDIAQILGKNPLLHLRDFRVAASEIGFVRLTEESALQLLSSCGSLQTIGGICDWNTRDLLTFLHKLLHSGGWKIILDQCQDSKIFR